MLSFVVMRYRRWLREIGAGATQLAKGDLSQPIKSTGPPPIAALVGVIDGGS